MTRQVKLFVREMYRRFFSNRVLDLAAQCAYYFMLSMFPFLIFLISMVGFLPISSDDVLRVLSTIAPESAFTVVKDNIHQLLGVKRTGLLSFSILFTIISAQSGIDSLIHALNYAYGIRTERSFIKAKFISFVLMLGMVLGIFTALLFNVLGPKIGELARHYLAIPQVYVMLWDPARVLVTLIILNIVFLCLYVVAPNQKVSFLEVLPGSLFAYFGWHYISLAFAYYVSNFNNFSAMYGSLGAIIALMVWFYLSAVILIIGGQMNAVLKLIRHSS